MNKNVPRFSAVLTLVMAAALPAPANLEAEPAGEIRAVWIQAWVNDLHSPEGIDQVIATARDANINTLIPQVRRRGDTLYFSEIEPRISQLANSDFDALQYMIDRAREQEPPMEVHAWIVVYPIGSSSHPDHTSNRNPDWLMWNAEGGTNDQHDPGHPGVHQYLLDISMELITKYDIDGLHFDYIRYPEHVGDWGHNPVSIDRFHRLYNRTGTPDANDEEWRQFRRDQITQTLRRIYLYAMAERPEVKVSAATITWGHSGVSNIDEWWGSSAYAGVYQDWRGWMEEGILDLNIPMNYYREHNNTPPQDHAQAYRNWATFAKDHRYNRHVAIGPGIYLNTIRNGITQIRVTRDTTPSGSTADGVALYAYHATNLDWNSSSPNHLFYNALVNPSEYDDITPPVFAGPAAIPDMPWKSNPATGHLKGYVRDAFTGNPIDGAWVQLSGDGAATVQTDPHGFYGFVDLAPGNYSVTAAWQEAPADTPPMMTSVSNGNVTHQDLYFAIPENVGTDEIVVDNSDERVTLSGSDWRISTFPGGYGDDYLFTHTPEHADYAGPHSATYTPDLHRAGLYRIDTWYVQGSNRSPDTPYTVSDGQHEEIVPVNQRENGSQWVTVMDEISLDPADEPFVVIGNDGTGSVVIADAVRWVLLEPDEEATVEFSVTSEVIGHGRLEGLPESGLANHGAILDIEAAGEDGFLFSHWEGNAWGSDNPLSLPVGGDLHLRAVFVSAYSLWAEEHFESDGPFDPDADPGGYGIPNVMRFAFGLDATQPQRSGLPRIGKDAPGLALIYQRRAGDSGVVFRIEESDDLIAWNPLPDSVSENVAPLDGGLEEVTLFLPLDLAAQFFRVSVELPVW